MVNDCHKIQNFRQISDLFSQIWLKKRHTSLFSGIWREIRKKFIKNSQKKCKIRIFCDWISEYSLIQSQNFLAIFDEKIEIRERCKGVHCVDLGESFPTSIYLQKSASIQPRTSRSKFGRKLFNIIHSCPQCPPKGEGGLLEWLPTCLPLFSLLREDSSWVN